MGTRMMNAPIILLKEGSESAQGKSQVISNITACQSVAEAVRTTLGPRGMDKLIVDAKGSVTISNDGATILKRLDIVHPSAKTLVDIAKSQDEEVGDGTTSVVLLAAELLKQSKAFVEEGLHPQTIIKSYRKGRQLCIDKINEIAVKFSKDDLKGKRSLLEKCALTSLSSKLVSHQKEYFAQMVVLRHDRPPRELLSAEHRPQRKFFWKRNAGFEMQPKSYTKPKIALLNVELELKAEKDNAEVRVDNVEEYQKVVDAEWDILYEKLAKIHESGAKVVLSKLPIGDVATQYFADRDLFCAGRVPEDDLKRTMRSCGGSILTTCYDLNDSNLGTCEDFEELQIGGERFNVFKGCPNSKTVTIILRGGAEQFMEETERSLHDAIMIVRRALKNDSIVAGGGAIEMEISKYLREYSRTIPGKEQLLMSAMAKAFEVIPRQLCENAGFDATNILNKLRQKHSLNDGLWFGVDINNEDIANNFDACVWEPAVVKTNAITAATEAACLILSVDETIKGPKSQMEQTAAAHAMGM
ncbi:unnamed protein product [Oppiella nova]|uniref:T-complex protein 1 subunit eta n=1 Tax=Oppiella nova TaxID=334625 RepID=A0A7R9LLJ1_9ACAR|nr:unnamed protein product [Oppiella nova]CAG2164187.1 unnamed protein product [Oppiella nova]